MLNSFFENRDIYIVKSKFGIFSYDIDVNRKLPRKPFFDRVIAKEALLYIDDIFKSENITFFLIFGTCLGAIRENDFIEHDIDIDLGTYKRDKDKLITAIKKILKNKDFSILKVSHMQESITLVYKGIVIDIGLFILQGDYYIYNDFYENKFPRKFLDSLDQIVFFNRNFNVPHNVHSYLVHQYGKDWKKPIEDWNYFNKFIPKKSFNILRSIKKDIMKYFNNKKNSIHIFKAKITFLSRVFSMLNITNITSIERSGQGFCDTYIVHANKSFVLKKNNSKRFNYFKNSFKGVEPIYSFIPYSSRFKHEKKIFEKLYEEEVFLYENMIIFPFIPSKPLSKYLFEDNFFNHLKKAIDFLYIHNIRHGDFHIDNILIDDNNNIFLIDFEMIFSDYLTKEEQFNYDIYYFFSKLEYQYPDKFMENYNSIKSFINENFSSYQKKEIIKVANKTKKYFFSVNGARIDLFE